MPHFEDLAPHITRQRLVIEGYPGFIIADHHIKDYLTALSDVIKMKALIDPVTNRSHKYGWAGWIHWETSGAHFYAWEAPMSFLSVDIYACKAFDVNTAVNFTNTFFSATKTVHESF